MSTLTFLCSPRGSAFSLPDLRRRLRSSCGVAALALAGMGGFAAPAQAACPTTPDATNTLVVAPGETCAALNLATFPAGTNLLVTPTGSIAGTVNFGSNSGNITINGFTGSFITIEAVSVGKITVGPNGRMDGTGYLGPMFFNNSNNMTINGVNGVALENNGQVIGDTRAIHFRSVSRVNGSIVNNGLVSARLLVFNVPTTNGIYGHLVNNGTVEVRSGGSSNGIATTSVAGNVINTGTVKGAGVLAGISLSSGTVGVDVRNSGTIQGFADGVSLNSYTVNGGLINAGIISSVTTGANISGASAIAKGITNSKTISAATTGISVGGNSTVAKIDNSGTISGGTTGVSVAGESSVPTIDNLAGGVISGGTNSIRLAQTSAPTIVNNAGTLNGAVDLGGFNTLNILGNAAQVIGDTVGTGTSAVTVNGNFTTGGNFFLPTFTVAGGRTTLLHNVSATNTSVAAPGVLQIGDNTASGNVAGDIANDGLVDFKRSDAYTYAGVISGNGSVAHSGANVLTLSGNNTYRGTTAVNAGTLLLTGSLASTADTTVASGATLQVGGGASTGSLASANIVNDGAVLFNRGDAYTYAGVISGAGSLTQNGPGVLTLSGNNTYAGPTSINAGTLLLTGSLASPADATVASGATLQIGDGGATGALASNIVNNGAVLFNRADAVTYDRVISGRGSLTQKGPGELTLTADHNYTGDTTVAAGALRLRGAIVSSTTVDSGATFTNEGLVASTIANNGVLNLDGVVARVTGAVTGTGVVNVNGSFTSENSFAASAFNVNGGGVFNMNNGVAAPVTVANGGRLNLLSSQTVDGNILNNGIIDVTGNAPASGGVTTMAFAALAAPGANVLTTTGSYTQTAGATFITAINYIGAGGYGQLKSAQALNVADGAVLLAAFASSEKYADGTVVQDVLQGTGTPTKAGKITLFAQNQLNIPRYRWEAVWDGSNVDLVLSRYDGALSLPTLQTANQNRNAVLGFMHQRFALLNAVMEYDCAQFDKFGFCLSVQARATGFGLQSTGAGAFNMAYRFADKFRIGGFVDYQATYNSASVGGYTPESVYAYDNRPTFGGYAGFSETGYTGAPLQKGMQLFVSGGVNAGRVSVTRAMLTDAMGYLDAQPGSGTARLDAYFVRGVAGYGLDVGDGLRVMPYVGLRYTDVTRGGYVEGLNLLVTQPLAYESFYERLITGFSGAQFAAMLTPAMGMRAGLGVEVDFNRSANNYSGVSQIPGLSVFSLAHGGSWNGARPAANGGVFYNIAPNHRIFLNGAAGQQAYTSRGYASGMLGYQAAF
jgi:autotransporter-associated beta strand protein